MKKTLLLLICCTACAMAQSSSLLTDDEVRQASTVKVGDKGFTFLIDMASSECDAQQSAEYIYTPTAWLAVQNYKAKQQFLPFSPSEEDRMRSLTIVSRGCARGSNAGPLCTSITRTVLLSDKDGTQVVEAEVQHDLPSTWQNGFGTSASCLSLLSKFPLDAVKKIRNAKGEFYIATFSGSTRIKVYQVKEKYAKRLDF